MHFSQKVLCAILSIPKRGIHRLILCWLLILNIFYAVICLISEVKRNQTKIRTLASLRHHWEVALFSSSPAPEVGGDEAETKKLYGEGKRMPFVIERKKKINLVWI